jgi:D-galactosamine 6-phosphate deaminase/isomerase
MDQNLSSNELIEYTTLGEYTSKEILGQPNLWIKVWELVTEQEKEIANFIGKARKNSNLHIILTGAGSSAFIGDVLEGPFQKETGIITKAVPTTDLVTHPELYFQKTKDILLISFARSGNSPESAKVVKLAEQLSHKTLNLVITCNEKSDLINTVKNSENFILLLPREADDKGLAMTGSFTSMLLAGMLIMYIKNLSEKETSVFLLKKYGEKILSSYLNSLKNVSEIEFERAVFLGSGIMKGIARESHLKLQELTDGKIICKHDSFLGFRHGPKAVIDETSLITFLFSNNKYVNKYEVDLVNAINQGRRPKYSIGIMENKIEGINSELSVVLGDGKSRLEEEFLTIASILPAQILGFYKSIRFGLNPDNPSESGMIHRVVQGVKLYPYKK